MEVVAVVLERVPLLGHVEALARSGGAGELRVGADHARLLLLAVADELAADHQQVGIVLVAERLEAVLARLGRMEGIRRGVAADEALPALDGVEEGCLALGGHGRVLVGARRGQDAGRVEEERVELRQVLLGEDSAVLGVGDFPVVLLRELGEDLLGVAGLVTLLLDDAVLEARRLGEEEDLLLPLLGGGSDEDQDAKTEDRALHAISL